MSFNLFRFRVDTAERSFCQRKRYSGRKELSCEDDGEQGAGNRGCSENAPDHLQTPEDPLVGCDWTEFARAANPVLRLRTQVS